MKCPKCKRGNVVGPRVMTPEDGPDVTAYWCGREECGYYRDQPYYSSHQLSDALREHARGEREHADRSDMLMTQAANMLRDHRAHIMRLEDSAAHFKALAGRLSDYFHVNAKPENDLAQGYMKELDTILCRGVSLSNGEQK